MNIKILLALLRNVTMKSFDKGEILIQVGSTKRDVYYIRKGLVRSYMVDEDVNEITFQIYAEHQVFTNAHSVLFNESSKFYYQTLEHTKVYIVDYNALLKLTSQNAELLELNRSYFGKKVIEQVFQRVESFVFLSPEERYKKFVQDNPKLIHRVPDKYIANVLGITPVSLSRIRNRISKKK
ncbi:MAG: Crp/Fnr family transcriptional regulator [Saprospiraceae bacterium]|nr:Crp/Fnr family transcriptional regulator [Saprospiraceae bacterium]